jgi:hypothetical protein
MLMWYLLQNIIDGAPEHLCQLGSVQQGKLVYTPFDLGHHLFTDAQPLGYILQSQTGFIPKRPDSGTNICVRHICHLLLKSIPEP